MFKKIKNKLNDRRVTAEFRLKEAMVEDYFKGLDKLGFDVYGIPDGLEEALVVQNTYGMVCIIAVDHLNKWLGDIVVGDIFKVLYYLNYSKKFKGSINERIEQSLSYYGATDVESLWDKIIESEQQVKENRCGTPKVEDIAEKVEDVEDELYDSVVYKRVLNIMGNVLKIQWLMDNFNNQLLDVTQGFYKNTTKLYIHKIDNLQRFKVNAVKFDDIYEPISYLKLLSCLNNIREQYESNILKFNEEVQELYKKRVVVYIADVVNMEPLKVYSNLIIEGKFKYVREDVSEFKKFQDFCKRFMEGLNKIMAESKDIHNDVLNMEEAKVRLQNEERLAEEKLDVYSSLKQLDILNEVRLKSK